MSTYVSHPYFLTRQAANNLFCLASWDKAMEPAWRKKLLTMSLAASAKHHCILVILNLLPSCSTDRLKLSDATPLRWSKISCHSDKLGASFWSIFALSRFNKFRAFWC